MDDCAESAHHAPMPQECWSTRQIALWLMVPLVLLLSVPVRGLDPGKRISQYAHAAWRAQDGFFKGSPSAVTQTRDGYLWLATTSGLLRFDGVRFVPWTSDRGEQLPSPEIYDLHGASDGSLWIASAGGLSRWKDRTLTNYRTGVGGSHSILEDHKGKIWFIGQGQGPPSAGAPCQVSSAGVRCLGSADGIPLLSGAGSLMEDAQHNLWIGGSTALFRWSGTSKPSVYQTSSLMKNSSAHGIVGLAKTSDGTIWIGITDAGPGLGLQRLIEGRWQAFKTPELDGSTLNVTRLRLDREGSLWIGTADRGVYRIHDDKVDHFDSSNGLSSDMVMGFTEDREGNLWVATGHGVDRFSETPVISFSVPEGLCSTEVDSVIAARDGGVWVGGAGALSHMRDGRVTCLRKGKELPGSQVTSLLEDHAGRLWVGVDNALWIYERGAFRNIARADGSPIGFVTGIAEDAQNDVWVVVQGPPRIMMRIRDLTVREEYHPRPMPRRVAADPAGGMWVGTVNGDLAHYGDGKVTNYEFVHDDAALLNQLLPGSDSSVLAATSYGLIGLHKGKRLHLTAKNGLPCDTVNAMTVDGQGDLWLFMDCALGQMAAADLQKWKNNPEMRVPIRTFGVFDGVRTGWAAFNAGATSSDGRVWFANIYSLQMVDPARLRRNAVPPPVHIEQVIADRKSHPVTGAVHLPPLTRDLEIDYVGLSFAAPQKVLFRYRLEGRDETWQEAGTRRQAFYTDLRPGTYRFRVTAANNDGVWNEQGAALDIIVAAAWYQTSWFLLLCAVTVIAAVWALYQLRMRQVARSLTARFDERLAERTRMARDIHDTLLQTVHGSKMVADHALKRPDDASGMRGAMAQLSVWLGQASAEGREAVNALRSSTRETNDLAEAFRRAIEECRQQGFLEGSLSVSGDAREMHPVVRDEVYRIGYEAIRNACTHSGGNRMDVALTYAGDLTLRVSDNGAGIDPAFVSAGKEGHFGLQGMRERAVRIGARLNIVSSAGSGTEVVLIVPGRIIFHERAASLLDRIRARS